VPARSKPFAGRGLASALTVPSLLHPKAWRQIILSPPDSPSEVVCDPDSNYCKYENCDLFQRSLQQLPKRHPAKIRQTPFLKSEIFAVLLRKSTLAKWSAKRSELMSVRQ
jgi:hypothetical protein